MENFVGQGLNFDIMSTGMIIFGAAVSLANMKIIIFSNTFYPFSLIIIFGSISFYIMNFYVENLFRFFVSYNIFHRFSIYLSLNNIIYRIHITAYCYFLQIFYVAIVLAIDLAITRFRSNFPEFKF